MATGELVARASATSPASVLLATPLVVVGHIADRHRGLIWHGMHARVTDLIFTDWKELGVHQRADIHDIG